MNISVGLFTYSFCRYSRIRWRASGSKRGRSRAPWKPHCERNRKGEKERKKRALQGYWTLYTAPSPWRRARFVEGKIYPLPLWRGISDDAKSMSSSAKQSRGNDTLTLERQSDISVTLSECPRERFFRTLHCYSCDVMETDKKNRW